MPRMKEEEEEATGRGGAELGRSAAQFTEPGSASPASRAAPASRAVAGLSCATATGRAADLGRPAGEDATGLAGTARFAAGAPCSRVID